MVVECRAMDKRDHSIPVVALLASQKLKSNRSEIRGFLDYAERHGPWRLVFPEGRDGEQSLDLERLHCDAVVVAVGDLARAKERRIAALGVPVVRIGPFPPDAVSGLGAPLSGHPCVTMDSRAVGEMAAEYFLGRGYRSFAYVGETQGMNWSEERRDGFLAALKAAGFGAVVYDGPKGVREKRSWDAERPRMIRFLRSMPMPAAVFAAMDGRARLVIDACMEAGLRVPEDVAVLGVDDDPILCMSCVPPLSSIRTGGFRRGFVAAELLDEMMHGRKVEGVTLVEEPLSVMTRGSTGYDAMRNPIIARALAFIRDRGATEGCTTIAVAAAAHCSRRYLEKRFRALLGASVRDLVLREKIERAKTLLEKGAMPIGDIPEACGIRCNSHLSVLFKKATGFSMRDWRLSHRDADDA